MMSTSKRPTRRSKTPTRAPSRRRRAKTVKPFKPTLTATPSRTRRAKAPSKVPTAKPYELKTRDMPIIVTEMPVKPPIYEAIEQNLN